MIYIVASTWKIFPSKKNITTIKSDPTLPQPTCLKELFFKSSNVMNFHPRSEDPTGIAVLGLLAGSCPAFSMESLTPWDTCESIRDVLKKNAAWLAVIFLSLAFKENINKSMQIEVVW